MPQNSVSLPSLRSRLPKDFAFTGSPYHSKRSWINFIPFSSLNQIQGQFFKQKELKLQAMPRGQPRYKGRRIEREKVQVDSEYLDEKVTKDLNKKLVKLQKTMEQMQELRMKKVLENDFRKIQFRRRQAKHHSPNRYFIS